MHKVPTISLKVNPDRLLSGDIGYCTGSCQALESTLIKLADDHDFRNRMSATVGEYTVRHHWLKPSGGRHLVQ